MESMAWTLNAEESEGVMRVAQSAGEREAARVTLEVTLAAWSAADLRRAAALLMKVAVTLDTA